MKILIAPDKFKGSLQAREVCEAVEAGIALSDASHLCFSVPLADGGEGSCELLTQYAGGTWRVIRTVDPLGRTISSRYGVSPDGRQAFIESAGASGLELLHKDERDPVRTSSAGTGVMIRHALENGTREIVLGVGGTATNDMGTGMAEALGFVFSDENGNRVRPCGGTLRAIKHITLPQWELIRDVKVKVLCDVTNPLYGPDGAAFVYAAQKGATPSTIRVLDQGLRSLAGVVRQQFGVDLNFPGAGAGGGLSAGAHLFLGGELVSGIQYMIDYTGLEQKIMQCDVVVTGEGKLDSQSLSGKVVDGVSALCRKHKKPFYIITGVCELDVRQQRDLGAEKIISLEAHAGSREAAIKNAANLIRELTLRDVAPECSPK
jgi:glycerate 2-kinase